MATEAPIQAPPTPQEPVEKITFTPEQQARIDAILREAQGRAGGEVRRQNDELKTNLETLKQELEAAKADLAKAKSPGEKKDAKAEADALAAQIAEMKQIQTQTASEMERLKQVAASKDRDVEVARKEALNVRKQVAIQSAAANQGFVDVEVVAALTSDAIQYDSEKGRFFVAGENGQPRLNSAYEQMTLDEFYQEFATKKPYLVRGEIKGGAGSTEAQRSALNAAGKYPVEQIFGPKSDPAVANKLALQNPKEYSRLKAQAREQKLISW
jgi:hypothetical protein